MNNPTYIYIYTQCPRRNVPEFGRVSVPYVKVYQYNPKHLYPKLNSYGENGQRKVRSYCSSTYCTCSADALRVHQNAQSAKLNQYFNTAGYSCAMQSAWKPNDDYGVNASVYVVQRNGFMSLIR